jgi:glutamyl-tRNA reductase
MWQEDEGGKGMMSGMVSGVVGGVDGLWAVASAMTRSTATEVDHLKKRLKDKMTAQSNKTQHTKADATSRNILGEAQSVMDRSVETPKDKLARLKLLRDKLAQVKD